MASIYSYFVCFCYLHVYICIEFILALKDQRILSASRSEDCPRCSQAVLINNQWQGLFIKIIYIHIYIYYMRAFVRVCL